jgi:hypothetical protein
VAFASSLTVILLDRRQGTANLPTLYRSAGMVAALGLRQ